jgi:phosphopantetheine adenylyltransferase
MGEATTGVTAYDIEVAHEEALASLSEVQQVALAREILAVKIADAAKVQGVVASRRDTLDAVFEAEAGATNRGFKPLVNFFLPLDQELPLRTSHDA